jgi:hypothetical protein
MITIKKSGIKKVVRKMSNTIRTFDSEGITFEKYTSRLKRITKI